MRIKGNDTKANRINRQITAKKVFLIDETGQKLGAMSLFEAIDLGESKGLDVVEVARNEFPPVCKLMDYGRHCFVLKKNQAKSKKENKFKETKELQVRPNIEEHDFQVKLKHLVDFLKAGYKVNIILKFKGRQIVHPSIGLGLLERFANTVKDFAKVEAQPVIEGKKANMLLAPMAIPGNKPDSEKGEKAESQENEVVSEISSKD